MSDFYECVQQFEGKPIGAPRIAPDVVNAAMIRHWCRAMEISNPIYLDADAARAAGHPGIVAPPTMLQSWTNLDRRDRPLPPYQMQEELRDLLAEEGFTTVVAVNLDQEYDRYLVEGEKLTSTSTLGSISPEKQTRFGPGHFVTTLFTYENQTGEVVGRASLRCLFFRPSDAQASGAPRRSGEGAAENVASTIAGSPAGVGVGDRLPDLTIPITPSLIIIGAISTMDFNVIHHDRDRAQADGSKDILMNIHTTNGLLERYAGGWAGTNARLGKAAVQLGAPNFPGDEMTLHGEVTQVVANGAGADVQLKVRGVNSLGNHATATVDVWIPDEAS